MASWWQRLVGKDEEESQPNPNVPEGFEPIDRDEALRMVEENPTPERLDEFEKIYGDRPMIEPTISIPDGYQPIPEVEALRLVRNDPTPELIADYERIYGHKAKVTPRSKQKAAADTTPRRANDPAPREQTRLSGDPLDRPDQPEDSFGGRAKELIAGQARQWLAGGKEAILEAAIPKGLVPEEVRQEIIGQPVEEARQQYERGSEQFQAALEGAESYPEEIALQTLGTMVQMGPAIATSYLTKRPDIGLAMMSTQAGAAKYAQSKAEGRSHEQAMLDGGVVGTIEAVTEKIPLGILTRVGGKAFDRIWKGAAAEAIQEPIAQGLEMAYDIGMLKDDHYFDVDGNFKTGEAVNDLMEAGLIGGLAGGGIGVTVSTADGARQKWSQFSEKRQTGKARDILRQFSEEDLKTVPEYNRQIEAGRTHAEAVETLATDPELRKIALEGADVALSQGETTQEALEMLSQMPEEQLLEMPAYYFARAEQGLSHDDALLRVARNPDIQEIVRTAKARREEETGELAPVLNAVANREDVDAQQASRLVDRGMAKWFGENLTLLPRGRRALAQARERGLLQETDTIATPETASETISPDTTVSTAEPSAAQMAAEGVTEAVPEMAPMEVSSLPDIEQARMAIDAAANQAATSEENDLVEPTEAQREAGNYQKGHLRMHGMDISIENPRGTKRREDWPELQDHYGDVKRTTSADGENLDVFIGPEAADPSKPVFVVDQKAQDGQFDEQKALLGFDTPESAREGYQRNYTPDFDGLGGLVQFDSVEQFRDWSQNADPRKPASETAPEFGGTVIDTFRAETISSEEIDTSVDETVETPVVEDAAVEQPELAEQPRRDEITRTYIDNLPKQVRDSLDALTPEQRQPVVDLMYQQARTSAKTGLPNREAFEEDFAATENPTVVALDMDGLGWFNDNWGHDPTDEILSRVGEVMQDYVEDGFKLYHRSGDEFMALSTLPAEEVQARAKAVQAELDNLPVEVEGINEDGETAVFRTLGLGISYGVGTTYKEADNAAIQSKQEREESGERSPKGEAPVGVGRVAAEAQEREGQDRETDEDEVTSPRKPVRFAKAPSVESDAFKRWFGDSKVVDENGEPLVVYHGTNQDIQSFSKERAGSVTRSISAPQGFFFTNDPAVAEDYAANAGQRVVSGVDAFEKKAADLKEKVDRLERKAQATQRNEDWSAYEQAFEEWENLETDAMQESPVEGQNILPAYLSIQSPLVIDANRVDDTANLLASVVEDAKKGGHDGVIIENFNDSPNMVGPATHYIVFAPTQVKSAVGNRGTFDPSSPNILFRNEAVEDAPRLARAVQRTAESGSFRRWFGRSVVKDAEGNPRVLFHSPTGANASTEFGPGYFLSGQPAGAAAAQLEQDATITGESLPTFAKIERPFYADSGVLYEVSPVVERHNEEARKRLGDDASDAEVAELAERMAVLEGDIQSDVEGMENFVEAIRWAASKEGIPDAKIAEVQNRVADLLMEGASGKAIADAITFDRPMLSLILQEAGFDGLISGTDHMVFSPQQIRSAMGERNRYAPESTLTKEMQEATNQKGMRQRDVNTKARRLMTGMANAPALNVVKSWRDLPWSIRMHIADSHEGGRVKGVFNDGLTPEFYLVSENLIDDRDMAETVYHEIVGHYGVHKVLNDTDYVRIMDGVAKAFPGRVNEAIKRNGLDQMDLTPDERRRIGAEEYIAYTAQDILAGKTTLKNLPKKLRFWFEQLIEAIRRFFGMQPRYVKTPTTENDIIRLIARSYDYVRRGRAVKQHTRAYALRSQSGGPFYSQLIRTINDKMPNRAPPKEYLKQLKARLGKDGLKPEEFEWSGLPEALGDMRMMRLPASEWANDVWTAWEDIPGWVREELNLNIERYEPGMTYSEFASNVAPYSFVTKAQKEGAWDSVATWYRRAEQPVKSITKEQLLDIVNDSLPEVLPLTPEEVAEHQGVTVGVDEDEARSAAEEEQITDSNYLTDSAIEDAEPDFGGQTKWKQYMPDGGKNYNEHLYIWDNNPDTAFINDVHWDEAENVLVHVRSDDRKDAAGKPYRYVDEIQSDWQQEAREKGLKRPPEEIKAEVMEKLRPLVETAWKETNEKGKDVREFVLAVSDMLEGRSEAGAYDVAALLTAEMEYDKLFALGNDKASKQEREDALNRYIAVNAKAFDGQIPALVRSFEAAGIASKYGPELRSYLEDTDGDKPYLEWMREKRPNIYFLEKWDAYVEGDANHDVKSVWEAVSKKQDRWESYLHNSSFSSIYAGDQIVEIFAARDDFARQFSAYTKSAGEFIASVENRLASYSIRATKEIFSPADHWNSLSVIAKPLAKLLANKEIPAVDSEVAKRIQSAAEKFVPENRPSETPDAQTWALDINELVGKYRNADIGAGVQLAPFRNSYPLLALKHQIQRAVEDGMDTIAFAGGEVHANRWGGMQRDGSATIRNAGKDSNSGERLYEIVSPGITEQTVKDSQLEVFVGKPAADVIRQKMLGMKEGDTLFYNQEGRNDGPALTVSRNKMARGLITAYNDIYPKMFNKFLKKYGMRFERTWVPADYQMVHRDRYAEDLQDADAASPIEMLESGYIPIWRAEISEKAKRVAAGEGFPLFAKAPKSESKTIQEFRGKRSGGVDKTLREIVKEYTHDWKARMNQAVFDDFYSIRRAEEQIAQVDKVESGYMSARLARGADTLLRTVLEIGAPVWDSKDVATRAPTYDRQSKPLFEIMAPLTSPEMLEKFKDYMVAKRAQRLKREGRERLFTDAEIKEILDESKKYPVLEQVHKEYAKLNKQILDFAEAAGVIDGESRKLWENDDYVPFYRVMEDEGGRIRGPFVGSGRLANLASQIRTLVGSERNIGDPIDNVIMNWNNLLRASLNNHAAQLAVDNLLGTGLVTKAKQVDFKKARIPVDELKRKMKQQGVILSDEGLDRFIEMYAVEPPSGNDIISIFRNGKREYYHVADPLLFRSLTAIGKQPFGAWMNIFRIPKRILTSTITLAPAFQIRNWFRDAWSSFVLRRDTKAIPMLDGIRGAVATLRKTEDVKEMMAGGASFESGYVNAHDPAAVQKLIRGRMREAGFRSSIVDTPLKFFEMYRDLSSAMENANRVPIYQSTVKEKGIRKLALYETRDIMDFSMRGDHAVMRFLSESVAFLNARLQGMYRIPRTWTELETPKEKRKYMAKMATLTLVRGSMIMGATLALYLRNRGLKCYQDLPEYDKDLYYHFFVGDPSQGCENMRHYRLPKPFEMGAIFSTLPERMVEFALSKEPDSGKLLGQRLKFMVSEMMNLNPTPTALEPPLELALNYDTFRQSPILNRFEQELLPELQYDYRTSPTFRFISEQAAKASGAPDWLKSPKQLEHLASGYLGTLFNDYALLATDASVRVAQDYPEPPAKRLDEMPFIRSFVREHPLKYTKHLSAMYEVYDEVSKYATSLSQLEKRADLMGATGNESRTEALEKQIEWLERTKEPELIAAEELKAAIKEIGAINEEIMVITLDADMPPAEKREEIDRLFEERNKIAEEAIQFRPGGPENPRIEDRKEPDVSHFIGMNRDQQIDELKETGYPATARLLAAVPDRVPTKLTEELQKIREA